MVIYLLLYLSTIFILSSASSGDHFENKNNGGFINQYNIGPFLKIGVNFEESLTEDKLRLSKWFFEDKLIFPFIKNPLFTLRVDYAEDLLKCEDLTLEREDYEDKIDCKALSKHFLDNTFFSAGPYAPELDLVRYSHLTVKTQNLLSPGEGTKHRFDLYPLKPNVVKDIIKDIGKEHELDLFVSALNFGYHLQTTFRPVSESVGELKMTCTADLILSINNTETYHRTSAGSISTAPNFGLKIDHYLDSAIENGYLVGIRNAKCTDLSQGDGSGNSKFTLLKKNQFPYLFMRHNIWVDPYKPFLNLNASIDQIETSASSYNTSILIETESIFSELLNFRFKQIFENKDDSEDGSLFIKFVHKIFGGIMAKSGWGADYFWKIIDLDVVERSFATNMFILQERHEGCLKLAYADLPGKDKIDMSMELVKECQEALAILFKSFLNLSPLPINENTSPIDLMREYLKAKEEGEEIDPFEEFEGGIYASKKTKPIPSKPTTPPREEL